MTCPSGATVPAASDAGGSIPGRPLSSWLRFPWPYDLHALFDDKISQFPRDVIHSVPFEPRSHCFMPRAGARTPVVVASEGMVILLCSLPLTCTGSSIVESTELRFVGRRPRAAGQALDHGPDVPTFSAMCGEGGKHQDEIFGEFARTDGRAVMAFFNSISSAMAVLESGWPCVAR